MADTHLKETREKMDKAIKVVEHELGALRTGRASTHLLDGIRVNYHGTELPLNQLGTVTTPDAASIMIQPWDPSAVGAVEKAIMQANIGLTPTSDGKVIRMNVPPLTEETRREMVKRAKHIAEEGRVAVRNVRKHTNEEIKKDQKNSKLTEDESKRLMDQVQKFTDEHVKKIDELVAHKEKEIMTV